LSRRTSCSCRRRRFFGRGCARANVCEVLAHPHFSQKYRPIENIIARRAAAIAPFPLDIVGDVVGADLLAMAIDAAVCCINSPAPLEHSRLRARKNVRPLFVGFRIEMSDLPRWNDREADPRKRERAEDSQEERSKAFHARLSSADPPSPRLRRASWRPPFPGSRKRGVRPFINGLRMSRLQPG
jgi:hypothetical protein